MTFECATDIVMMMDLDDFTLRLEQCLFMTEVSSASNIIAYMLLICENVQDDLFRSCT